ncbi:XrtA system polysaccharide chain length determinant [Noviherbaspirillum sp.]|uniref:XrtA system polysaccharide chain length determinant n=1 Tax=Noviherbaspirillum sp. TaxID=1926288 RepID=UPI002FE24E41
MEQLITQVLSAVKGIWKYRWYSLAVSWVAAIAGFAAVYIMPNNYQASARVFVDTESILKPLLAGMTTIPDLEQQVSIMSKTLLSRPNVERVMRMVDLDINAKSIKEKEATITNLMNQIKITGTSSNDIYSISYNNADPRLAKNVVQSLLTIFIEGSFGDKMQGSANAVRFIDEQIKQYEEKLLAAESAIKEFRLKHAALSGREGEFGGKLVQLEEQLNQARLELNEAEEARNSIKREIAGEEPIFDGGGGTVIAAPANPELDDRIQTLTKTLDSLRLQFTEQHPDVVATKRLIAQLEARKLQEAKSNAATKPIGKNYSPVLQQLKVALSDAEARVASMRARVVEYSGRVARLKAQANAVPEIEAQFAQLNRDYQVNKNNYEKLIASRDAAKLSGDLSATSEMISFRIIDPPTVPAKPAGPNRPLLFSAAFLAAIGMGIAVAFGMSQIRPTFLSLSHLREVTGFPVLGSVSMNWTELEKKRRKRSMYAFVASFVGVLIFYAGGLGLLLVRA